jgi:ABC-type uncharacterized transport system substrate-binding protein
LRSSGAAIGGQVKELLSQRPQVVIAATDVLARDVLAAGASMPVIFVLGFDPVGVGLIKSLNAPGGRATGFAVLNWELNAKRLSLLKEAVPAIQRVAILYRGDDPRALAALELTEGAAGELQMSAIRVGFTSTDDFTQPFDRMSKLGVQGVINVPDSYLFRWRSRLAGLALKHRIAAMFGATEYAEAGMLLSYGTQFSSLFVRAAALCDRILKGADPASIPVEQPTAFELVVDRRTARALGIPIPRSLLVQATRVIE